jgi:hypothetical protein
MHRIVIGLLALGSLGDGAFQTPPFQRDKVMRTRDRIPYVVLDDPAFVPAAQATYLADDELVLGVSVGGDTRAYPIRLMDWHHIANDTIGATRAPIAVVY